MDKLKSEKEKTNKDAVQNEKLVSLLIKIRGELAKIREKLRQQKIE